MALAPGAVGLPDTFWAAVAGILLGGAGILAWVLLRRIATLKALLTSERRLRDLTEKAPIGVVIYRDRKAIYANPACLHLLGMPSLEEMIRRNPLEFYAPHERNRILGYIVARERGEPAPTAYEVDALREGEGPFPLSVNVAQVRLHDGPAVVMFLEDASERNAARTALQAREKDYRGLFEAAHDAILLIDAAQRTILDANPAACDLYGYDRKELVGLRLGALAKNSEGAEEALDRLLSEGTVRDYGAVHLKKDGAELFLDINASAVDYGNRKALLVLCHDVSDLRRSEENYRLLVENQTDIFVKLDARGRIVFASPSFCRLFGRDLKDLLSGSVEPLIHEDDLPATLKIFEALKAPPHHGSVEHRLRAKDGWRHFACTYNGLLDESGRFVGIVGAGHDITERLAAEEALRESEQRFRALAENSTAAIVIYQDDTVAYANRTAEKITGYSAQEFDGLEIASLIHPDYRELLLKRARSRQHGEPVLSQYEAPFLRKDGTVCWLLISASRILYRGQPAGVIAAFDVTERRDAEEKLRQAAYESQAIFNALPDLYFRLNTRGEILDWRAAKEGTAPGVLYPGAGKKIQEVFPEEAAEAISMALWEAVSNRRTTVAEYRLPSPVGGRVYEAHLAPLFQDQAVAVVRDITERARLAAEVADWKRRYEFAGTASGQVVYEVQVEAQTILWSASLREVLGYTPEEIRTTRAWGERIHPDEFLEVSRRSLEAASSLGAFDVRYRLRHRDGHYLTVHDRGYYIPPGAGYPLRMIGTLTDVTEMRLAQDALRRNEEQFRLTFDLSPVGAVVVDLQNRFTRCNETFCRFLGYEEPELLGHTFIEFTHPEDVSIAKPEMKALMQGKLESFRAQKRYIRKDGQTVWGEITIRLLPATEDRAAQFISIIQDITERKRSEQELLDALRHVEDEKAKTDTVLATMADGVSIQDLGFKILYQNDTHKKTIGDRVGEVCYRAYECREAICSGCPVALAYADGGTHTTIRSTVTPKGPIHVEITASPLRDHTGAIIGGIECIRDVTEREGAAEALRLSEHRYRTLMETANDAIFVASAETGMLVDANRRAQDLIGRSLDEICAMHQTDLHPAEDRKRYSLIFEDHIRRGEAVSEDILLVHKDGHIVPTEVSASLFEIDGRGYVQGIFRDVAERRRTEAALRESEERFRFIAENITEVFWMADPRIQRMYYISPAYERVWGRTTQSLLDDPRSFLEAIHPEDRERVVSELEASKDGRTFGIEYRIVRPDGSVRTIWDQGFPVFDEGGQLRWYVGVAQDVTERRQTEAALAESEARLRKIIEQSPLSMAIVAMDGAIEYINQRAIDTFGYLPEDIPTMERWWVQAYPDPAYREEVISTYMGLVEKAIAEGREIEGREYRPTCKDGTVKTMLIFGVPVADKIFVMFQDVTERRRTEDELRLRNRQLLALTASAQATKGFLDTKAATRAICESALVAFGATMAWVGLVVPDSTEITPLSSAGRDDGYTHSAGVRWDGSPRAMGPTGRAATTRKPQVMRVDDPAFALWRKAAERRGYRTVCALPILNGDEVRGVITIYSDRDDTFGPEMFDLFEVFARQCAMVLVNASLYEEAQATIKELWAANEKLQKR